MRTLVEIVRGLTQPTDTVLLLPDDPNVAAWFDRPRPPVGSAIVFVDQYGMQYVDADVARLRATPPKVIVIGPRNWWSKPSWNSSVIDLIRTLRSDVLPGGYTPYVQVPIVYRGLDDAMEVWLRRDTTPPDGTAVAGAPGA